MAETPTPGAEDFVAVEVLVGTTPFVFLVGLVCGLVASVCLRPLADWTGVGLVPSRSGRRRGTQQAALLGGIGLVLAFASEFLTVLYLDAPDIEFARPGWSAAFLLSAGGGLAAVAWFLTFRDAANEERLASRYSYAAFAGIWTALVTVLYASWF